MTGQGSTGNVIAALCSFFIPGLGQLLQGRLFIAIVQFCLAAVMWIVLLGWLIHLWTIGNRNSNFGNLFVLVVQRIERRFPKTKPAFYHTLSPVTHTQTI